MRINSELAAKRKGLSQTFDHSRDQEVPRHLDHVGSVSFLADDKCLLPNRVEKWPTPFDLIGWSRDNDEQLRSGCGVRPAEHWRGQIVLLLVAMTFSQMSRQPDADGAHGNMSGAGRQHLKGIDRLAANRVNGSAVRHHCE